MTNSTLIRKPLIGAGLQFRGLDHYCHGGKHRSMQVDTVLERYLKVLHSDWQVAEDNEILGLALVSEISSPTPTAADTFPLTKTHLLQ